MTKIENYYLDLKKLDKLEKQEVNRIYEMYRDMLYSFQDSRLTIAESFFNTLYRSGYLVSIRDEKLEKLLDTNDSVST